MVNLTLFETTLAVVVIVVVVVVVFVDVVVVVFVIVYNKSKVEVCFNLGPLVMLTLVTRCPNQIKGNTFVCSNQTNSFPNVCNGLR